MHVVCRKVLVKFLKSFQSFNIIFVFLVLKLVYMYHLTSVINIVFVINVKQNDFTSYCLFVMRRYCTHAE